MKPGGMSDETIPEYDPPYSTLEDVTWNNDESSQFVDTTPDVAKRGHRWHTTAAEYCYDNGHTGDDQCVVCGESLSPVRRCDACNQTYVKSRFGDNGICQMCEIAETGIRNMIADEIRVIMDDYRETILERIRNGMR